MRKHLTYINGLGPDYKGDNLYEFVFSETLDVWGPSWDSSPSNGYPTAPDLEFINKVGVLRNSNIKMYQNVEKKHIFIIIYIFTA